MQIKTSNQPVRSAISNLEAIMSIPVWPTGPKSINRLNPQIFSYKTKFAPISKRFRSNTGSEEEDLTYPLSKNALCKNY